MTAERCPRCDRAECRTIVLQGPACPPMGIGEWVTEAQNAEQDCATHAVDWRTRAIAAESSLAARDALIASMEAAAVERVAFLAQQMKRAEAAESERDALRAALNTAHSDIRDLFTAIGEACRAVMDDIDLTMADGEGGNGRRRIEDAIRKLSRTALRKPDAPDAGRRGEAP